jgi:hypothetical protein
MWKEAAFQAFPEAEFRDPVDAAAVNAAEQRLGCALPAELRNVVLETDGIIGHYGTDTLWSLQRIVEQNLLFWSSATYAELYMPFDALLFFGDNGAGDQFAFVRTPRRPDIFVWEHEDDSRRWVASGLADYLTRSLQEGGDEWYRQ